jgi:hypothetical protein
MSDAERRVEEEKSLQHRQTHGHEGRSFESWARDIAQHAKHIETLNGRVTSLEYAIATDSATKAMMGELLAKHDRMLVGEGEDAGMRTELIILKRQADQRRNLVAILIGAVATETMAMIYVIVSLALKKP